MPSAANIVVKNAANADKTFTLIAGSGGFGANALWQLKDGAIVGAFPWLTTQARKTGNQSQVAQVKFSMPSSYVDTTTSRTIIGSSAQMNATFSVPNDFPEAVRDDFSAYCGNLIKNAILTAQIRDGVPAT